MKKIEVIKDLKKNRLLLKKNKNVCFYSYNEFFENSYYLSFHKQNLDIVIYDINNKDDFEKIYEKLRCFKISFLRKGIHPEKYSFNSIVFLYKNIKELSL